MKTPILFAALALAAFAAGASAQNTGGDKARKPAVQTSDFNQSHHFQVEIDGIAPFGATIQLLSGPAAPVRLLMTPDPPAVQSLWQWWQATAAGRVQRKSISIVMAGGERRHYNLFECWPTRWSGPSLNAKNSGQAVEKIEISCERMELR